jgi:hypothetical protein
MKNTAEDIIDLGKPDEQTPIATRVRDLGARVKRIVTTDEGKLQVVLESEGMDNEALDQVRELLLLQQACPVLVSMDPVQRDLFDA